MQARRNRHHNLQDAHTYVEIMTLVGELEWRMRELERSQRLRASLLSPSERDVISDLISRLRRKSVRPTTTLASPACSSPRWSWALNDLTGTHVQPLVDLDAQFADRDEREHARTAASGLDRAVRGSA
jgi:hypothetical protein